MLCVQRFAASSLFKRTIYQHIAEELLAAGHAASPAVSCPIDSRARPLITLPSESPLQRLFTSLDFEDEAVDRHKLAAGLQRLGGAFHAMQCNAMQCDLTNVHVVSGLRFRPMSHLTDPDLYGAGIKAVLGLQNLDSHSQAVSQLQDTSWRLMRLSNCWIRLTLHTLARSPGASWQQVRWTGGQRSRITLSSGWHLCTKSSKPLTQMQTAL